MNPAIKTLWAAGGFFAALALAQDTALAAPPDFRMGPGLSMDIWVTWPDESRWGEREMMLPFPEWRQHLDESDLEAIKATGITMLRLPVDPSVFLSKQTGDLREDLIQSVLETVRLIRSHGMTVILDLHSLPAGSNRSIGTMQVLADETLFEAYLGTVRDFARLIAREDPEGVALELMNEPVSGCETDAKKADWNARLKRLYAAARSSALETTLVLTGACWGGADGLAAVDPTAIPDDNVIWSFHSYAPFILTHQGAGWTGDVSPYATGIPFPPHGENAEETAKAVEAIRERVNADAPYLRRSGIMSFVEEELAKLDTPEKLASEMEKPFAQVSDWAKQNGIDPSRILLGEFGMIRQEYQNPYVMKPEWRAAYVDTMIGLAQKHGFAWSVWGYGGAFGVMQEFESRTAEPHVRDVIGKAARR